jgi:hypothetical protein
MALKPYAELVKLDVKPFCDSRKAKDDSGKQIDVFYLNWAKCIELLYANGAESAYYVPLKASNGSYVFTHYETQNKDGRKTGCYFVEVNVMIDGKPYPMSYPLMNGSLVVYDDTLNQLRIDNAHKRAFVKAVAIFTGLGFELWSGDNDTDKATDDLSVHSVSAIKERVERQLTGVMKRTGMSQSDICAALGITERSLLNSIKALDNVQFIESGLMKL